MLDFLPTGTDKVELHHRALSSGASVVVAHPSEPTTIGLVLHPDIYGLRPLIDDTLSQLASIGIATIAVEPFAHVSDNPTELTREERYALIKNMDDAQQCADLIAAEKILRTQHNCARVCMIGFCLGGMYAFKVAGTGQFDAVISCYGMISLPDAWLGDGQREPMEYLAMESASKTLAIVGGQDHNTAPEEKVEKLRNVLSNDHHSTLGSEMVIFPEAGHGFMHDPAREEHRPADAATAWKQVLDLITQYR